MGVSGLVSIIIPAYNCEQTIKDTLKSIQRQTYVNFEVIIIDDGSTDDTYETVLRFVADDKRFRIFTKPNKGVSAARNTGISNSHGEYIMFADGDDQLSTNMIFDMVEAIKKENTDLVVSGYTICYPEKRVDMCPNYYFGKISEIDEKSMLSYFLGNYFNAPWNKIFRSSIIQENDIFFNESISILEDLLFVLNYLNCSETIGFLDLPLYMYSRTSANTLLNKVNERKIDAIYMNYSAISDINSRFNFGTFFMERISIKFIKDIIYTQINLLDNGMTLTMYDKRIQKVIRNLHGVLRYIMELYRLFPSVFLYIVRETKNGRLK